jgi:hypothetical protein
MLVRETRVLSAQAANAVDALVAPMVAELNVPRLTRAVRAAVAAVDPAGHQERAQQARRDRSVAVRAAEDGMGEVHVWAPMEAVVAVQVALDAAVARARAAGDPRSPGEVRCDELIARVTGRNWTHPLPVSGPDPIDVAGSGGEGGVATSASGVPGRGGGPVSSPRLAVTLTMTLSTWLGLRDDPATLGGEHLMPAGLARDLAVRMPPRYRGWLTRRGGAPWSTTSTPPCSAWAARRTPTPTCPTARLAEFVRTAEPLCTFPGCGIRAARCDLDHRVPHPDGATCAQNLQPCAGATTASRPPATSTPAPARHPKPPPAPSSGPPPPADSTNDHPPRSPRYRP